MSSINFIHTPSPEKQRHVFLWYRATIYLIATASLGFLAINGYQLYEMKASGSCAKELHQVTERINLATDRIKHLTTLQEQLKKQHTKLTTPKKFKPAASLRAIATAIPHDTCLFTADLRKKGSVSLTGYTDSAHALQKFVQSLETSHLFDNILLSSLQPEHAQDAALYRFTLSATLPAHPH